MLKRILLTGAMIVSAPAWAQGQTTPSTPPPADQPAAGTPATSAQIAAVVDSQFPTYDKDGDGALNAAEFATWMTALRTASNPGATTDGATLAKWANAAFAQADVDQSKSVSKAEFVSFLSKGQG